MAKASRSGWYRTFVHGVDGLQRVSFESVGLVWSCLPRMRGESTDLTSILSLTKAVTNRADGIAPSPGIKPISIETNVAIAARFQIPKGSGVFLLIGDRSLTNARMTGMIISSSVQN